MDTILPSHPANYRTLLNSSINLYKASYKKVLYLSFMLSFIAFVPRLLSDLIGQDIFLGLDPLNPARLWLILINLAATIFLVAILWRLHCVNRGVHEPYIEDLKVGCKKFFMVFVATIFESILLFGFAMMIFATQYFMYTYHLIFTNYPSLMLVTTGVITCQLFLLVYVATLFIFMTPIIAVENKHVIYAIEKSMLLTWNHWWRVFSLQITPWLAYLLFMVVIRFVLRVNIHIYFLEQGKHFLGTTIIHMIIFALFIPWVAAVLLVQLNDLELRKQIKIK